jgi:hypothetical protein
MFAQLVEALGHGIPGHGSSRRLSDRLLGRQAVADGCTADISGYLSFGSAFTGRTLVWRPATRDALASPTGWWFRWRGSPS